MALPPQKSVLKKIQSYIQKKGSTAKHKITRKKAVLSFIQTGQNIAALNKSPDSMVQERRKKLIASQRLRDLLQGKTKKKEKDETRLGQRPIRQLSIS